MIKLRRGKKHPDDRIVLINGHQITYKELAKICVIFAKNEDNIYPPPAQGGQYFVNFLTECMNKRCVDDETMEKYKL
tara:strand:- start:599 stop:829 length:231 start_codon:yes stop_codon:yes gene_type:complete